MGLASDYPQYVQCYAFMQIPFFDGQGNNEAAHKQQDNPVHVLVRDIRENNIQLFGRDRGCVGINGNLAIGWNLPASHYPQQRVQNDGQQRGSGQRYCFGDPPDRHEQNNSCHARDLGISRVQIDKQQDQDKNRRTQEQADPVDGGNLIFVCCSVWIIVVNACHKDLRLLGSNQFLMSEPGDLLGGESQFSENLVGVFTHGRHGSGNSLVTAVVDRGAKTFKPAGR